MLAAEAEIAAGKYRGRCTISRLPGRYIRDRGVATTGHSKVMQDHVPKADAFSVKRLQRGRSDRHGEARDA